MLDSYSRVSGAPLNPCAYWKMSVLHCFTVRKTLKTVGLLLLESGCESRQAYQYGYSWDDRIYWHRLIPHDKKTSHLISKLSEILNWELFFFCDIALCRRVFVVQRFGTVLWPHIQGSMDHCFVGPLTFEERISQTHSFESLETHIFGCLGVTSDCIRNNLKVSV